MYMSWTTLKYLCIWVGQLSSVFYLFITDKKNVGIKKGLSQI